MVPIFACRVWESSPPPPFARPAGRDYGWQAVRRMVSSVAGEAAKEDGWQAVTTISWSFITHHTDCLELIKLLTTNVNHGGLSP